MGLKKEFENKEFTNNKEYEQEKIFEMEKKRSTNSHTYTICTS